MRNGKQAVCIMFNDRYFCKFGKKGQVQSAWSLAGATLFSEEDFRLDDICAKMETKGYDPQIVQISATAQNSIVEGHWQNGKVWLRVFDTRDFCHLINPDQIAEIFESNDPDGRRRFAIRLHCGEFVPISKAVYKELSGVEPKIVDRVLVGLVDGDEDIPF
jgi:hypothetical protein